MDIFEMNQDKTIDSADNSELITLTEDIFRITLSKTPISFRNGSGIKALVYLEELSLLLDKQTFDLTVLEYALFERLILKDIAKCVITADSKNTYSDPHVTNDQVFNYLFDCYKSSLSIKCDSVAANRVNILDHMISLIIRNAATALMEPDLYEQDFQSQIVNLLTFNFQCCDELLSFFVKIAEHLIEMNVFDKSFKIVFLSLQKVFQTASLSLPPTSLFKLINGFFDVPGIVNGIIKVSQPEASANGFMDYENTLLGSLLSINVLPKPRTGGATEMFSKGDDISMYQNVWYGMDLINFEIHKFFLGLLKVGGSTRQDILQWLGQCISYNTGRNRLSNLTPGMLPLTDDKLYISDGFSVNLYVLFLNLSSPFTTKAPYSKLYKVDPTYCVPSVKTTEEMNSLGIHLLKMNEETCLVPLEEGEIKPIAKSSFSFITECFFMTHKAIEIGMKICLEKMTKLSQEVGQLEHFYRSMENGTVDSTGSREFLGTAMRSVYSRFIAFRCVLMEPNAYTLISKFMVATISWVVQVLIDDKDHSDGCYAPEVEKELTFPLPEVPPITYKCIPEFVVDNLCTYLIFSRRYNIQAFEDTGFDVLRPLLTGLIVLVGSKNRVRNPHLRARLAEGIECLLPTTSETEYQTDITGRVTNFYRSKLFYIHPHRRQLIPALLDIFVGIEMTGDTVQFEQKFNYRRPMYRIVEYLFSIPDQVDVLRNMAKEAEQNIAAVSPPLFLRFINILINDAIFLLDEAMANMAELRRLQNRMQQSPTDEDRESRIERFHHIGTIARFDNILGSKTVITLKLLTTHIKSIFCHPTVVDRMASMLNYFLSHLVGPKKKNLKVKDMEEYSFDPAGLVLNICQIYFNLSDNDNFCKAVSADGRSYTPQLFVQAEDVLVRLHELNMMRDIRTFGEKVAVLANEQESDDALLADAPEDYLDPIMSTLMLDPVILPTSNKICDRSVISRHLLSDQSDPFNRMTLTMDMLVPNTELKKEIHSWIEEKKKETAKKSVAEKQKEKIDESNEKSPSQADFADNSDLDRSVLANSDGGHDASSPER